MTKTTDNHLKNEWTWVYYNKTLFVFKITGRETLYSRKRWHRFNFPCSFPLITTRYPKNYSTDTCKRTLKVELMWTRHGAQIWRMTPLLVLWVFYFSSCFLHLHYTFFNVHLSIFFCWLRKFFLVLSFTRRCWYE